VAVIHRHGPADARSADARPAATGGSTGHDAGAAAVGATPLPVIALVGRPNVGKSTFLARASGRFAETANAPGTTVGEERRLVEAGGHRGWLVDLPGTRSLLDRPAEEDPFWERLLAIAPDALLVVADAGDVARHLPLVLACRDLGLPVVVALNLADEAERRGIDVDAGRLQQLLVAPVHRTVGRTGQGVRSAVADALRLAARRVAVAEGLASPSATVPASIYPPVLEVELARVASTTAVPHSLGATALDEPPTGSYVVAGTISTRGAASLLLAARLDPVRWQVARRWATLVTERRDAPVPLADRFARLATRPWPGLPLFLGVTFGSFAVVVIIGGWIAAILTTAWAATVSPVLATVVPALVPMPAVASALLWALDGGLLGMLTVGIPYVLTFYLVIAALEDSGYLTSAAVLMDRLFSSLGLPGRAAIPLLTATGCNVPAIYGTRVLRTRRERLLGATLVTLTPCSARSAVVVAALAPLVGPAAAFAAFALVAGITLGVGLAANAVVPGRQSGLVLELAPIRRPLARHVMAKAWWRFRSFVVMATPIMLAGSLVLGLVYEAGWWAPVGEALAPAVGWLLGLPAVAGVAIVFGFLRKELALQLLIALAAVMYGSSVAGLSDLMGPEQLFVFAVVTTISVPCIATVATLRAELGGRAALGISLGTIGLALAVGGILARLLGIAGSATQV
jgi:ferrous iron transport protein B